MGRGEVPKGDYMKSKIHNFILSCVVPIDIETKKSKGYAFVDLSSADAAKLVIDAWNNKAMKRFPNRLSLSKFDSLHQKQSKEEREKKE